MFMKTKKIFTMLSLMVGLLVSSLAFTACGGDDDDSGKNNTKSDISIVSDGTNIKVIENNDTLIYRWTKNKTELVLIHGNYSNACVIPEYVNYEGKMYPVTAIYDGAFQNCYELISVIIPNTVKTIGEFAFAYCYDLTSVTIGNGVTSIGDYAFWGSDLKKVIVEDIAAWCKIDFTDSTSNPLSGADLYSDEKTKITDLVIPNSVTSINDYAFDGCSGLTSVTIPNSVTSIGKEAFEGCSGLTSVTIGNSVESIGESAFKSCSGLTSVTIGNSVTTIYRGAFQFCSNLSSVICLTTTPPICYNQIFSNVPLDLCTLIVPKGCASAYKEEYHWKDFGTIVEQ